MSTIPGRSSRCTPALLAGLVAVAALCAACAPAAEEEAAVESPSTEAAETAPEREAAVAEEVEAAVDEYVSAWEREDVEGVAGWFTADGVAFDPVPPGKFEGSEGIRDLVTGTFRDLDEIDITLSERSVRTDGPFAWFHARYVFAARPAEAGAEPIRDEGYVSMVWVRQEDGSYETPLFHASPMPREEPPAGV